MRGKIRTHVITTTPLYFVSRYMCLNSRHAYILYPDIGVWISDTPKILYPDRGMSEFQTLLYLDAIYTSVWISDSPIFCIQIWLYEFQTPLNFVSRYRDVWISDTPSSGCKIYRGLNFRHPYIWMQYIRVSEFQTPLCFVCRYMCLNFRHTYILYPDKGMSEFQTPLYLYSCRYTCLNFRHTYILYPDIGVSEFQTPLCLDARYTAVWITDTPKFGIQI